VPYESPQALLRPSQGTHVWCGRSTIDRSTISVCKLQQSLHLPMKTPTLAYARRGRESKIFAFIGLDHTQILPGTTDTLWTTAYG